MFNYTDKVPTPQEIKKAIKEGQKPMLFYQFPHEEVKRKDLRSIEKLLSTLTQVGKEMQGRLVIGCKGYDHVTDELFEIQEVREFVEFLFRKHPYLLYYISKDSFEWVVCSYADEVHSMKEGKLYTSDELFEKFGLDMANVPLVRSHVIFKNGKFDRMLNAVIKHGKIKKDEIGGKRIAIEYAFLLNMENAVDILQGLGISADDIANLMKDDEGEEDVSGKE
ncbi:hypothetical protein CN984_12080 [Bacillus cereus]|uniref:Uncharacterized protein n=1 Tax=Bacillus cereus TaxID=1396 RepID=A0A2B9Q2Q5_BACCE|nr:hypothetical protein [Bacillus cereus]PEA25842.1 hypothetical protein CON44_18015 [Bacillus cereus]PGO29177.1 hypothetical protein CN984_12080 [Bacillus cereus]